VHAQHSVPEYWRLNRVDRQLVMYRQAMASRYVSEQTFVVSPLAAPKVRLAVSFLLP